MKRTLITLATLLALVSGSAPAWAQSREILPYGDGSIPEEEQNTEQLIPIQTFRNTVYFEGFMLYYTQNRFNIVTRYKPPACPGGQLDAAFYTKTITKYGFVTTPEHVVEPAEGGQEDTFSTFGYFGPLDEAKVQLNVRSSCVLTPQAPVPSTLPELPTLPPFPENTPDVPSVLPEPETVSPTPPLSHEELFKKLVPVSPPSNNSPAETDSTPATAPDS